MLSDKDGVGDRDERKIQSNSTFDEVFLLFRAPSKLAIVRILITRHVCML